MGRTTLHATGAYTLLALVMTWPLVTGLARDVPWDLGDPLLNMWILSWDMEQLRAILGGDFSRIPRFFDANIFHPSPLTLAYSEHLFPQALQALPVYLASANPILCYNLLFLSTFVLSGLGAFLLVREITGSARAGFVAGLLFAFAPYRWTHASHLQVLSSQWMPFALYGFRRYFDTGRRRALAGGAAALTLQNLSCGYFLLYFAPVALAFVTWEIGTRRLWRSRRTWIDLAIAAAFVAAATAPFLVPYTIVRNSVQLSRDISEIVRYSADVYSYLTAYAGSRVWADVLRAFPKPEGDLFPGAVPLLLAAAAVAAWIVRSTALPVAGMSRVPRWVLGTIAAIGAAYVAIAVAAVFARRLNVDFGIFTIRATNVTRLLVPPVLAAAALVWLSPAIRNRTLQAVRRPEAIFLIVLMCAWWLSLGPLPRVLGRPLEIWSPYRLLYDWVPGFDGMRAPARFAMIEALALSALGGLALAQLGGRAGGIAAAVLSAIFLIETHVAPIPLNASSLVRGFVTPEARVYRPARAPAVYHAVAQTAADAVVLEMPFGGPDYDLRAVYYSTAHWRRLVNGYSGFFPLHYSRLSAILAGATRGDDLAWPVLTELGVTHVIVHERAYLDDEGARFAGWLRQHGAAEVFSDGSDVLLALPR
jgi:hypothetical protein